MRSIILALALCLVITVPAAAITFEFLTNPTAAAAGFDLTHDGSRAVANFQGQVYLMDEAGNFTLINTIAQATAGMTSISADGTVIVTNTVDINSRGIPVIMRESEGWVAHELDTPDGYDPCDYGRATAYDISGDGSKVTGLLWDFCAAKAFLWTEATGMLDAGPTRCTAMSQDGTVMAGFDTGNGRRPAYWTIDGTTTTGPLLLHHEEDYGEVHDISSDGEILIGTGLPYGFDPILTGYQAFRYEMGDTNFTLLGTMSGSPNDISVARFISDDGVIIGTSGPSSLNVQTFIWTPTIGMTSLEQYLIDEGVEGIGNSVNLTWPRAFSKDGSVFIGEYVDLYGGWGYYRVKFSDPTPVQDVIRHTARLTDVSPNPFNPMTTVSFSLDRAQKATVTVYDISGRKIDVLAEGEFAAGAHQLVWRGKDLGGREMPSGSYIVHLESAEGSDSRTISLVR
jgi:uncharacterized membrane protein